MNSLRTKKKLKTRMSGWLPLVFLCLSVLFFSYTVTQFGFAAETDPENPAGDTNPETPSEDTTPAYSEDPNYLVDGDYIVVTGVANTVEYLTSLYLYVTDPKSSTSVNMKYDPDLNALLINSSINANAMGIGFNEFGEGVVGSVFVGGSGNKITMRGQEILDEYGDYTGTRNGKNDSAVAIGGISNRPSSAGSVIVGGKNNSIGFSDSTMIGAVDSSLNGHQSVALGSRKSSLNVQDWNSVDMGYNNHGVKYTYLIGSGITTHGGSHWSAAVSSIFAYSPGNSGFELQGGNLGGQPGFYVNVKNGFGLNTSTPRLTFDFRSAGPLRVIPALGVQNNTMQFSAGAADGITCPDEVIVEKFRGTVAYVQSGGIGAFCGCNGKVWMPMSSDANEQALCAESKADARVCEGNLDEKTVIFHEETKGKPRWDEDANEGRGEWINLDWTFMGVPSLNSTDERECSYTCAVGYHPDNKSAKGWFTGNCVPCSELKFGEYISPGTGVNDCEFACAGGYKYDKWAKTDDGRCTPCRPGEWTENLNQAMLCNKCELPVGISAKTPLLTGGMVFNGGTMWNGTTGTGEPYFSGFIKFSTSGEYGCDFECASGYMYSYDGTETGNKCTECGIGTYSPGGQYPGEAGGKCADCTNRVQNSISFSYTDVKGKTYSGTIAAKDLSWYTTKGKNGPNSCEWICNPSMGLIKDGKSCRCPDNSHMELVAGKPKCVANIADLPCEGEISPLAIRGAPLAKGVSAGTLVGNDWKAKSVSWTYVSNNPAPASLGACEWTCPEDYELDPVTNDCKHPTLGKCGAKNGKLVDSLSTDDLCDTNLGYGGFTTLSDEIEINYYVGNKFIFYPPTGLITNPAKYLAIWTCKGYEGKPQYDGACFAYVKGEAKRAQCPGEGEWRDASGKAQAKCIYDTPNNCKEGKNCPPIMNKQDVDKVIKEPTIDLDNVLPHGLMWTCPGTFGGNPTACHSCDSGYSWRVARGGCTKDEIVTSCKAVSSNSLPNSRDYTNFGPEYYTNTFDKVADNYTPGVIYYKRLSDGSNPTSPCEWACQADTHFCSTRCELNPKCGSLQLDGSGNVIESYLCNIGDYSNVTLGDDGNFKWSCHNGCQYDNCGADAYSCEDTAPDNTIYVGATKGLLAPASYHLYPEGSPHLGEPCSLACAYGYKYEYGTCVKVDKPKCGEPNGKIWDWRYSPQYCEEAFNTTNPVSCVDAICASIHGAGTPNYYNCKATRTIYNYCDVGELDESNFIRGGHIGASWKCVTEDKSVSCSAGCNAGTDNHDPYNLCLDSTDYQSDSILVPNSSTDLQYEGYDSWLTVTTTGQGGLSGYGTVFYTATPNTGASRSTTVKFSTTNGDFCENWNLTIFQCGVGEKPNKEHNGSCRCVPVNGGYSCPAYGKPAHSEIVGPTDQLSVEPSGYVLYEDREEAIPVPCSVVCEEGYEFFHGDGYLPDRCDKCPDGMVLNEEKTYCIVEVSCPEGYRYNSETNGCDLIGNCLDIWNDTRTSIPDHGVSPYTYDESRPMGGNISWSCRNNVEDVRPNTCEFACKPGYLCSSDGGTNCFTPRCAFFGSEYGDTSLAVKFENPTYEYLLNLGGGYKYNAPWQYTGAGTLEAFNKRAYNEDGTPKVEGCWYWCSNNYVDVTTDPTTVRCIDPNVPANVYACIGTLTGVRNTNIISTDPNVRFPDYNRNWTFIESRDDYWNRVAQGEECLFTCKTGTEVKVFDKYGKLCAQECGENQYMTTQGFCLTCDEGYEPDQNNKNNGVIMGCVYKCDSGQIWNETLHACLANKVYTVSCPEGMEELGRTPEGLICGIRIE